MAAGEDEIDDGMDEDTTSEGDTTTDEDEGPDETEEEDGEGGEEELEAPDDEDPDEEDLEDEDAEDELPDDGEMEDEDPEDEELEDEDLEEDDLEEDDLEDEDPDEEDLEEDDDLEDEALDDGEDPDDPASRAGGPDLLSGEAPATETDPGARSDASGRDVTAPPHRQPAGQNPGLVTEDDPERMDFREFDSGAQWAGDDPAPDVLERDALAGGAEGRMLDLGDDPGEGTDLPPASADLIEAVTSAIEEAELLDIFDLSVERAGDTVILRGSAGTPEERDRAGELAGALRGVGRVQNLISAG